MNHPSPRGDAERPPAPPAGGLPSHYTPIVARYAPGPFLREQVVAPSDVKWMNARTYIVRDANTRQEYRAIRVLDSAGHLYGYWAVELMPEPLNLGVRFEGDRQDSLEDYNAALEQKDRDARRARYGRHTD